MSLDGVLRAMRPEDVTAVVAMQEPAAIAGLSDVFPQDLHPFPRESIAQRWRDELEDPSIYCFVITRSESVAGFAALRDSEVLHFGVELEEWGSGLAVAAHDELMEVLRATGAHRAWLRVYSGNARGCGFWQKLGWTATGERSRGETPPHAELLTYEKHLARRPPPTREVPGTRPQPRR